MTILVIGGGKMGMSHLVLASQYVGKNNVALCDTKFSTRLLFRILGYKTFSSIDLAAESLDKLSGVLIATPTSSHGSLARWAIGKKVPCFVEKPLTLDVKSNEEISTLADSVGVHVQVGFVMRYVASFQQLRHLVRSEDLGKLLDYTASMRGNVVTKPPSPDNWQGDFARGGGCLNEYGPHIIDLCCFIFGSVREVRTVKADYVYSSRADDCIIINWIHENLTQGRIEIDWCDTTKRKSVMDFQVNFEHASVRVDNSTVEIHWRDNVPLSLEERRRIDVPVRPHNVGFYLRGEEFSLELEDFLGTCFNRKFNVDNSLPRDITAKLKDGCEVDRLIDEVAQKAGLK